MKAMLISVIGAALLSGAAMVRADSGSGEPRFRALYKELVETNTTLSAGSCTLAAERMAAHLRAAGLPEGDLHLFSAPDHPKEGGFGRGLSRA